MPRYLNEGGDHYTAGGEQDATCHKHGAIFDSDDPDLCEKFPCKFKRIYAEVDPTEPIVQDTPTPETPAVDAPSVDATTGVPIVKEGYTDQTVDFPQAADNGLQILRDKRGWWVYEMDSPEDPCHDKALRRKKLVAPWLDAYLAEDEE